MVPAFSVPHTANCEPHGANYQDSDAPRANTTGAAGGPITLPLGALSSRCTEGRFPPQNAKLPPRSPPCGKMPGTETLKGRRMSARGRGRSIGPAYKRGICAASGPF